VKNDLFQRFGADHTGGHASQRFGISCRDRQHAHLFVAGHQVGVIHLGGKAQGGFASGFAIGADLMKHMLQNPIGEPGNASRGGFAIFGADGDEEQQTDSAAAVV